MTNSELLQKYRELISEFGIENVTHYPTFGELPEQIRLMKKAIHKRKYGNNFRVVK
jgi:hypothetical protein